MSARRVPAETTVADPVVTTHEAVVTFGSTTVLGPVTLSLPAGATAAVLGHNGAGKTTLLRMLSGSVVPASGSVSMVGLDPTRQWRRVARVVGSSFYPERAFYFRLTTEANLQYFQSLQKIFGRVAVAERERLLDEVGLLECRDRKFMELSLGQPEPPGR